jgi:hypothetical protein
MHCKKKPIKKQGFLASTREYPDEQVIVNEQCNLIIQYLEKTSREMQLKAAINSKVYMHSHSIFINNTVSIS